jgi:hypothetical protein
MPWRAFSMSSNTRSIYRYVFSWHQLRNAQTQGLLYSSTTGSSISRILKWDVFIRRWVTTTLRDYSWNWSCLVSFQRGDLNASESHHQNRQDAGSQYASEESGQIFDGERAHDQGTCRSFSYQGGSASTNTLVKRGHAAPSNQATVLESRRRFASRHFLKARCIDLAAMSSLLCSAAASGFRRVPQSSAIFWAELFAKCPEETVTAKVSGDPLAMPIGLCSFVSDASSGPKETTSPSCSSPSKIAAAGFPGLYTSMSIQMGGSTWTPAVWVIFVQEAVGDLLRFPDHAICRSRWRRYALCRTLAAFCRASSSAV